jgi:hypothetical protein
LPWFGLRIYLLEVSKEGRVCEVLQAWGIVRHDVGVSWEEVRHVAVSVLALVSTGVVAEMGCRPIAGHGSFGDTGHRCGVVRSIGYGGVGNVMVLTGDGHLGKQTSLFKVTVGDSPGRVCL